MASFVVFAAIAIPLGEAMHFIRFAPQWQTCARCRFSIPIYFHGWPRSFYFAGCCKICCRGHSKSDLAGWWTASVLFRIRNITNMAFRIGVM